jgi:hypothetical protein
MTLEELENTLPNGLHDADVQGITVDYAQRKVTFDLAVWVGRMEDPPPERREAYKNGRIEISGLLFFVMEPPDPKYPFTCTGLTIDGCDMSKNINGKLLESAGVIVGRFLFWRAFGGTNGTRLSILPRRMPLSCG